MITDQAARERFSDEHLADYLAASVRLAEAQAADDKAAEQAARRAQEAILALIPQPRPFHYVPNGVPADGADAEELLFHMTPAEVEHVWLDMAGAYEQARVRAGYDLAKMPTVAELLAAVLRERVA